MADIGDPLGEARRAAERQTERVKANQEISARNARIVQQKAIRERPKLDKPYIWSGPFYR